MRERALVRGNLPALRRGEASGLVRAIHTNFSGEDMNRLRANYRYIFYCLLFGSAHSWKHYCASIPAWFCVIGCAKFIVLSDLVVSSIIRCAQ